MKIGVDLAIGQPECVFEKFLKLGAVRQEQKSRPSLGQAIGKIRILKYQVRKSP